MLYRLEEREPVVASDCFVAESAEVIGSVEIGAESSVWFKVVIRGDVEQIRIGARTNVQDGSVLHADAGVPLTIGNDVTIGHQAMVHGCTIGDFSLIGIHATVLNHAVIGKHCIIGANALIKEGAEIPDRSLVVGSPGRVIRTLTDEQCERLEESAAHYVENGRRFAKALQVL